MQYPENLSRSNASLFQDRLDRAYEIIVNEIRHSEDIFQCVK